MKKTQDKLQKLAEERHRQLQRRQRIGLATVSLIGYTNAGKTSLFNMLSGKEKKVANALFATLDSTVAKVFLPVSKREFLISDTIGFIQNLPTKLIDAFKSTLMESLSADMLLHVVDISDPDSEQKIATVTEILHELGIQHKKTLFIFTKIDALSKEELNQLKHHYALYQPHWVSVKTGEGIPALRETIGHNLTQSNGQVISSNQI
jgi:GTP-binding protein HflX